MSSSRFEKEKRRIIRLLNSDKPIKLIVRFSGNTGKFIYTDLDDPDEGYWEAPWLFRPHIITKLSHYVGKEKYLEMIDEIYDKLQIVSRSPGEYTLTPQEKAKLLEIILKYIQ